MKRYFIPDKHGVPWTDAFREDMDRQGWKAEIISEYHFDTFDIYRTEESKKKYKTIGVLIKNVVK